MIRVEIVKSATLNKPKTTEPAGEWTRAHWGDLRTFPPPGLDPAEFQPRVRHCNGTWNDYEIKVKKSPAGDVYTVRLGSADNNLYEIRMHTGGKSVQIDPIPASSAYSHILAVWPSAIFG